MYILNDEKKIEMPKGTQLYQVAPEDAVAAYLNGVMVELYQVPHAEDKVEWISYTKEEAGSRIYARGILHLLSHAVYELYHKPLRVEYYLTTGLYCEVEGIATTDEMLKEIEGKMREYVAEDAPFIKHTWKKEEAMAFFEKIGRKDVCRLLKHRRLSYFRVYENLGYIDYFYGYMPYSAGILSQFMLVAREKGFILRFPTPYELNMKETVEMAKIAQTIEDTQKRSDIIGMSTVADLDEAVYSGELPEIIRVCEAIHDKNLWELAEQIRQRGNIRVVKVAGPSSSGKTTFAKRLAVHMRVQGMRTFPLGLDDYFIDRDKVAINASGVKDYENVNILNLGDLNEEMDGLIAGKPVHLSRYDFVTGINAKREKPTQLLKNEIIILEGTHGLNSRIADQIPKEQVFGIYISPFSTMNLDNHNAILPEDIRLLRRMVRDSFRRGHGFEDTLAMWANVRQGEFDYILPYRELADAVFNSFLFYEPLFLKKHALKKLRELDQESKYFPTANRLIKFLNYFVDVDEEEGYIRQDSILREFLGGSCFEH